MVCNRGGGEFEAMISNFVHHYIVPHRSSKFLTVMKVQKYMFTDTISRDNFILSLFCTFRSNKYIYVCGARLNFCGFLPILFCIHFPIKLLIITKLALWKHSACKYLRVVSTKLICYWCLLFKHTKLLLSKKVKFIYRRNHQKDKIKTTYNTLQWLLWFLKCLLSYERLKTYFQIVACVRITQKPLQKPARP